MYTTIMSSTPLWGSELLLQSPSGERQWYELSARENEGGWIESEMVRSFLRHHYR
jgi:hypothetical protein